MTASKILVKCVSSFYSPISLAESAMKGKANGFFPKHTTRQEIKMASVESLIHAMTFRIGKYQ